jgi:hypothetical protein
MCMWLTGDRVFFDSDNAPEWLEDICRDTLPGPLYRLLQTDIDLVLFTSLNTGRSSVEDWMLP